MRRERLSEQLARACFAEASYRHADCAAISGVVSRRAKRVGVSYEAMLHAYTALDRLKRVPSGEAWERHQLFAASVLAGDVSDPCPGSLHFYGPRLRTDSENAAKMIASGKWEVTRCTQATANRFLSEIRR